MGAHSRPRKGFNKTMAVAIAAGVAVTGGVQIAAPSGSVFGSAAQAADVTDNFSSTPYTITAKLASNWGAYFGTREVALNSVRDGVAYYDMFIVTPNFSGSPANDFRNEYSNVEGKTILYKYELPTIANPNPNLRMERRGSYILPVEPFVKNSFHTNPNEQTAEHSQFDQTPLSVTADTLTNSVVVSRQVAESTRMSALVIRDAFTVDTRIYGGNTYEVPATTVEVVGGEGYDAQHIPQPSLQGFTISVPKYVTQADNNNPLGKRVSVEQNKAVPKAETAISNTSELKDVKSYTWKGGNPSTATVGTTKQTVVVTYADDSTDEVTVDFDVTAPVKPVPNPIKVPFNSSVPTDPKQLISNITELPPSVVVTPVNPPAKITGPVTIEYVVRYPSEPNRPNDTIKVPFTVGPMNEGFDPKGQDVNTGLNGKPVAQEGISNASAMPSGTTYTWKGGAPDTSKRGTFPKTVTVTYSDKTTDDVNVNVVVTATDKEVYNPTANPLTVNNGDKPKAEDGIANKGELPNGTTYAWKQAPDTSKPGKVNGVVTVTYPDKTTDDVTVPVTVRTMGEQHAPTAKPITVKSFTTPKPETGILNPDKLPKGSTFTWEKAPDTSKPGKVNGVVRVKYPDGSTDDVSVPVTVTPIADEYAPKAKPLTVDNGDKPAAADGIANKPDLPKDVTYTWEKAPDTSKPGTTNPVAIVTYKDGSTDRVTVPVTVRPMAEVYNPIPQDVTVNRTKQPNAADAIKNKKDLPEGTKYAWKSPVDTSTGGKKPAVVVVTYPDGSREEVSTNVTVRPDNDVYTPTAKPITVNNGDTPNPADGIGNKNELPEGTKYTWEKAPDTSKPGNTEGVVAVTYPDGTKDRVTVPVTVRTQAEQFDPKPRPIESWTGENPPAIDGILNPDKLPKGTKFDWEKKPDTSKPGDTTGVVKVTYPDGSVDRVTVPVRVFLSGDDYQKILDDIAAHEQAIDDLNKEIDRVNGEVGKLKGDVNTLKNQMKQAQKDIERLQDQVKNHQDEIDALKKRADKIEQRLDGHDKDIANLKKRVGDLEQRVGDAERRLDGIDKQVEQIMAELERLDGNEIVEGVRNPDNSITLVKKDGRTVEIAPATKYGLEKCTAQLGGGLMALVPTLIVLSQAGNAVHLPGFEQQMVALQKQAGIYNPQIADFVAKNGPALAAGAVGLAVIGTMFIPGTCGSDSIANALGESLRGNPDAANPDVRETHDFKGPRFVPKPGTEGETATAGSSLSVGKDPQPTTPADAPADAPATGEGTAPAPETAAGATDPAPAPVTDNGADVLADLATLTELGNDTEDFDLAVADAFAAK